MKRLLLSLLVGMSLHGAASNLVELNTMGHRAERLFHNGDNFMVQHMGRTHEVARHDVHRDIRNTDLRTLVALQRTGYFDVRPSLDGQQYSVEFQQRMVGGGAFGAWLGFWAGHVFVTAPSYAVIGLISACTGPAAPATFATISVYATPAIMATANAVGLATGLAGAVVTGPV